MIELTKNVKIYYPLNLKPREQQLDGIDFIKKSINSGMKNMLLNLPTGVGKSYLSLMIMNWYKNFINSNAKFDIVTNSKILQDQYTTDYKFIKALKGRSNYTCDKYDTNCSEGIEICSVLKTPCNECPYDLAKKEWISSEIGLTNFHLFNTFSLFVRGIFTSRQSSVLIIDEAHDFESVFCDFISTTISITVLKRCGFNLSEIEEYDKKISKIKTIEQCINFIDNDYVNILKNKKDFFDSCLIKTDSKTRLEYSKYSAYCESTTLSLEYLLKEYENKSSNWILDITKNEKEKGIYSGMILEVKPVWVSKYLNENIWNKYDHIIFMSASILDKELFCKISGLSEDVTTYYEIPSPFSIENRPIFYMKVGKMSISNKDETIKKQKEYIKKILKKHKNEKGIIHCGTYEFGDWLKENLIDSRLIFHGTEDRDEALQRHIDSNEPSVLVSPSMTSGVDLRDDLSRFQIVMKIMYPYLGSNKIIKRKDTLPEWYGWKTCIDTIQSYGRSIRSETDYASTYIIDSNFSELLKYNSKYFPRWFTDAIKEIKIT